MTDAALTLRAARRERPSRSRTFSANQKRWLSKSQGSQERVGFGSTKASVRVPTCTGVETRHGDEFVIDIGLLHRVIAHSRVMIESMLTNVADGVEGIVDKAHATMSQLISQTNEPCPGGR